MTDAGASAAAQEARSADGSEHLSSLAPRRCLLRVSSYFGKVSGREDTSLQEFLVEGGS